MNFLSANILDLRSFLLNDNHWYDKLRNSYRISGAAFICIFILFFDGSVQAQGMQDITAHDVYSLKSNSTFSVYAVWKNGDRTNDRNNNWLYSDIPTDGGYNHFELRRYRRGYTLPGVFNKGAYAPPLRQAALWVQRDVFAGN